MHGHVFGRVDSQLAFEWVKQMEQLLLFIEHIEVVLVLRVGLKGHHYIVVLKDSLQLALTVLAWVNAHSEKL